MGRFFLFLMRLVAVTVAFALACVVIACLQVVFNAMMVPDGLSRLESRGVDFRLVIGLAGLSSLIGHAAFVPSAVMILIGEFARLRGWLVYTVGGGVIAGMVLVLADRGGVAVALDPRHVAIDLVSGMLGGLVYWLFAGHRAGRWLPGDAERRRASPREVRESAE